MPNHGDERNHHTQVRHSAEVELRDQRDQSLLYRGPMSSSSFTVWEKFCEHCETWVELSGVMGVIKFRVEHDNARCAVVLDI